MQRIGTNQVKKQGLKHQCYNQIYMMRIFKRNIIVTGANNRDRKNRSFT